MKKRSVSVKEIAELASKGVKTPCFVAYNLDITNHRKRLQGFQMALQEKGILLEKEHILSVPRLTFTDGFDIMKQITETMPEVDGIFFASDLLALGALPSCTHNHPPANRRDGNTGSGMHHG